MIGCFVRGVSTVLYCSRSCAWKEGDQVVQYTPKSQLKPDELNNLCLGCGRVLREIAVDGDAKKPVASEKKPPRKVKRAGGEDVELL